MNIPTAPGKSAKSHILGALLLAGIAGAVTLRLTISITGAFDTQESGLLATLDVFLLLLVYPAIVVLFCFSVINLPGIVRLALLRRNPEVDDAFWVTIDSDSLKKLDHISGSTFSQGLGIFIVASTSEQVAFYRALSTKSSPAHSFEKHSSHLRVVEVRSVFRNVPAIVFANSGEEILLYPWNERQWWWFKRPQSQLLVARIQHLSS